jgi:hypothetical protein
MAVMTSNQLITSLKRRAMLPSDAVTFSTQDFLDIINEELETRIVKILLQNHEEYLVNNYDIPLSDANLYNEGSFRIPYRALGNKLRGAAFLNSDGVISSLTRIEPENLKFFQKIGYQTYSFYIQNDLLILTQSTVARDANWLRMYYYLRPSKLVEDSNAAIIQSIDSTTGIVTVDKFPVGFSAASQYEFTQAKTPNRLYRYDIAPISIDPTNLTMTFNPQDLANDSNSIDDESRKIGIVPGDYVTLTGTSIVPQVPMELHPYLAQCAACACLEALGDMQGLQLAQQKLVFLEQSLADLFDNRVEGAPQKINNFNSTLGQTRIRYRRSYW